MHASPTSCLTQNSIKACSVQATGNRVEFVAVPEAAEAALASSTCETAGPIDLTFAVPPSCDLQLKLYFSSGNSAEQHMMRVHVNGVAVGKDYDFGSAGAGWVSFLGCMNTPLHHNDHAKTTEHDSMLLQHVNQYS